MAIVAGEQVAIEILASAVAANGITAVTGYLCLGRRAH